MKKINKLFATIISGTLLFSSVGTTAFAEDLSTNETPFYTYKEIQEMSKEEFLAIENNQTLYDSAMYYADYTRYFISDNSVLRALEYQFNGIRIPRDCFLDDIDTSKLNSYNDYYSGSAENVLKPEYTERLKKYKPSSNNYISTQKVECFLLLNSKGEIFKDRDTGRYIDNFNDSYYFNSTLQIGNAEFQKGSNAEETALNAAKVIFGYSQVFGEIYITETALTYGGTDISDQFVRGDVNMDKKIGLKDAIALNRIISQVSRGEDINAYTTYCADCYNDGKIDTIDSVILLQYLVGMHKALPVKPE